LLQRKGFPESYDQRALLRFMAAVKAGEPEVRAPVYSHVVYDIVPDQHLVVRQPDIVIVEGLNVLQSGDGHPDRTRLFVSDYFDFGIYVDAEEADVEQWFVERFLALRDSVFRNPESYFHRFAQLTHEDAVAMAQRVWREINGLNLRENILPTRDRATLILEKAADHRVQRVRLRKL
jgi:type I pantothenate kinase